ncbi:MAG: NDP-sugar synthase, partial [candidate division WOR-3 bacterium]
HLTSRGKNIHPVVEKVLKGTGGALVNFKDFVDGDFIVHSGDVLADIKLRDIVDFHRTHKPVATIVMIRHNGTKFRIGKDNRIDKVYAHDATPYTYAGIGVFSERVFSFFPQQDVFSIVDVFRNIIKEGETLMGLPAVIQWHNINSHYNYWKIHHDVLCGQTVLEGLAHDSPVYIARSSDVRTDALKGFVSIGENCRVARGVCLENTIVLPGTELTEGKYCNALICGASRITVT